MKLALLILALPAGRGAGTPVRSICRRPPARPTTVNRQLETQPGPCTLWHPIRHVRTGDNGALSFPRERAPPTVTNVVHRLTARSSAWARAFRGDWRRAVSLTSSRSAGTSASSSARSRGADDQTRPRVDLTHPPRNTCHRGPPRTIAAHLLPADQGAKPAAYCIDDLACRLDGMGRCAHRSGVQLHVMNICSRVLWCLDVFILRQPVRRYRRARIARARVSGGGSVFVKKRVNGLRRGQHPAEADRGHRPLCNCLNASGGRRPRHRTRHVASKRGRYGGSRLPRAADDGELGSDARPARAGYGERSDGISTARQLGT